LTSFKLDTNSLLTTKSSLHTTRMASTIFLQHNIHHNVYTILSLPKYSSFYHSEKISKTWKRNADI